MKNTCWCQFPMSELGSLKKYLRYILVFKVKEGSLVQRCKVRSPRSCLTRARFNSLHRGHTATAFPKAQSIFFINVYWELVLPKACNIRAERECLMRINRGQKWYESKGFPLRMCRQGRFYLFIQVPSCKQHKTV